MSIRLPRINWRSGKVFTNRVPDIYKWSKSFEFTSLYQALYPKWSFNVQIWPSLIRNRNKESLSSNVFITHSLCPYVPVCPHHHCKQEYSQTEPQRVDNDADFGEKITKPLFWRLAHYWSSRRVFKYIYIYIYIYIYSLHIFSS